jgi:hypothetical protein
MKPGFSLGLVLFFFVIVVDLILWTFLCCGECDF